MPDPYIKPGWRIFPCSPYSKQPYEGSNGVDDATDDPVQIAKWQSDPFYEGCNWAVNCGASGLLVVDPDGEVGESNWTDLTIEHGSVDTFEVSTPRGGRHLYYIGEGKSSVGKLAPKVDTRGLAGYVMLPGSIFEGKEYVITRDRSMAVAPAWIVEAAGRSRDHVEAAVDELDLPYNLKRARKILADMISRGEVAVEGAGGDQFTYDTIATLFDQGISEEKAFELLNEGWNQACSPEWEDEELRAKIENVLAYRQNAVGAFALDASAADTFSAALAQLPEEQRQGQPRKRSRIMRPSEFMLLPEPTWLVPNFLQDRTIAMLYGAPRTFKTFVALDVALTLASGIEGWGMPAGERREVLYFAGEGPAGIARKRFPAWCEMKGVYDTDIPFNLMDDMVHAGRTEEVGQFVNDVRAAGIKPSLLVIDTMFHFMAGLDESSMRDAGTAIEALEFLKRELNCTVLVLHHSGKDKAKGIRGSSAFEGGFDTVHKVVRDDKDQNSVTVWCQKQKDGEEAEAPWAFEAVDFAGSKVMNPLSREDHKRRTMATSYSKHDVEQALTRLRESPIVSTHALAFEMIPQVRGEDVELREKAVERLAAALNKDDGLKGMRSNDGWIARPET